MSMEEHLSDRGLLDTQHGSCLVVVSLHGEGLGAEELEAKMLALFEEGYEKMPVFYLTQRAFDKLVAEYEWKPTLLDKVRIRVAAAFRHVAEEIAPR
jgi:hypothetical protein